MLGIRGAFALLLILTVAVSGGAAGSGGMLPEGALARLGTGRPRAVDYSPDGQWLVVRTSIGVELRDPDSLELAHLLTPPGLWVFAVAFPCPGTVWAFGLMGDTVEIWDVILGERRTAWRREELSQWELQVSRDGTLVACRLARDRSFQVLDGWSGEIRLGAGQLQGADMIGLSPDGRFVVARRTDGLLDVWDVETGEHRWSVTPVPSRPSVESFWIVPDGKSVALLLSDGTLVFRSLETGEELGPPWLKRKWPPIAFSPDGSKFVGLTTRREVAIWDAITGEEILALPKIGKEELDSVALSVGGRYLAVLTTVPGAREVIRVWDATTGGELSRLEVYTPLADWVAVSADGRRVVTASGDGTARLWDVTSGELLRLDKGTAPRGAAVAASREGDLVFVSFVRLGVAIWNSHTGDVLGVLAIPDLLALSMASSPDGATLAIGDGETVLLLNIVTGEQRRICSRYFVREVGFLENGVLVAGGGREGLQVWDVTTGKIALALSIESEEGLEVLAAWTGGGLLALALGDGALLLWDIWRPQTPRLLWKGETWSVLSVAFSPDGTILASGHLDGTIRLWDVETGVQRAALGGHSWAVSRLVFSADGRFLASASWDGTVLLWDVDRFVHVPERTAGPEHGSGVRP